MKKKLNKKNNSFVSFLLALLVVLFPSKEREEKRDRERKKIDIGQPTTLGNATQKTFTHAQHTSSLILQHGGKVKEGLGNLHTREIQKRKKSSSSTGNQKKIKPRWPIKETKKRRIHGGGTIPIPNKTFYLKKKMGGKR